MTLFDLRLYSRGSSDGERATSDFQTVERMTRRVDEFQRISLRWTRLRFQTFSLQHIIARLILRLDTEAKFSSTSVYTNLMNIIGPALRIYFTPRIRRLDPSFSCFEVLLFKAGIGMLSLRF